MKGVELAAGQKWIQMLAGKRRQGGVLSAMAGFVN
jgi:hypothetical protein